jgi:hypothetical protein
MLMPVPSNRAHMMQMHVQMPLQLVLQRQVLVAPVSQSLQQLGLHVWPPLPLRRASLC